MRPILLISLLLLCASCGERLFVPATYSPDNAKAVVGEVENAEISVFVENIDQNGNHFIYDLEVINKTDDPVMVDPHWIYYYGAYDEFEPLVEGEEVHISFGQAAETARGMHALKEKQVNDDIKASIRTKQVVGVVLMLAAAAVVVNDVVQDSKDFNQEFWSQADQRRAVARDVATFAGLVTIDMIRTGMEMEQQREYEDLDYLPAEYLHKTLLLPGESIRGKVFLPKREVDYLRLVVPVDSRDYVFDFRKATASEMRLIRR